MKTFRIVALACTIATKALATSSSDYIVLLDKDASGASQLDSILAQANLHPSSSVITHIFNNSAFSGFIGTLDSSHVTTFNDMVQVKSVEKSQPVNFHATAVQGKAPWGLERISQVGKVSGDISQLDFKYTYDPASNLGRGVDVYVVDTGINTAHEAFGGRAKMVYSINGASDLTAAADQDGHGTHVSGTCCGAGYGAASGTNLYGVKVLGANGSGSSSDTIKGIDYVVQAHDNNKNNPGFIASIASMSWGLGGRSTAVEQAITSATEAGIHVVVAAGNDAGDACSSSPSAMGGTGGTAISVGSVSSTDTVSTFSNTGNCVDLFAPGENVISSYIPGTTDSKTLSGTSMSTPRKLRNFLAGLTNCYRRYRRNCHSSCALL
jgi:cerevisin